MRTDVCAGKCDFEDIRDADCANGLAGGAHKAGSEHVHRKFDAVYLAAAAHRVTEGLLCVSGDLHVHEHALELRGELVAALDLELADHRALGVVRDGAPAEQSLGQVLLVILFEDVLLLKVAEEHHHLPRGTARGGEEGRGTRR